jgi:hypothetical protein
MFPLILATVLVSLPLVPPQVKDAQSLYEFMKSEFSYQNEAEGADDWKEPLRTLKDKGGDCEDMAFFSQKVLQNLGYDTQAIAIYGKQIGKTFFHAITIFKTKNGKYQYFSNQHYSYFKEFESVNEIINFECPEWKWWGEISLPHEISNRNYKAVSY